MSRSIPSLAFTFVCVFTCAASAQVPDVITYSGRLTESAYLSQSAELQLVFRLYDAASEGALLWTSPDDPPMTVLVQDGYFSVALSFGERRGGRGARDHGGVRDAR